MDGPIGGKRPPRYCPVCGDIGDWNARYIRTAVRLYNDHLRTNHPDFRHWKRKLSATYAIPVLLLLVSVPLEALLYPTTSVNFSFLLPFWIAALVIGLAIVAVRGRGTRRFRELWLQEHGKPAA